MPLTATVVDPLREEAPSTWEPFVRARGALPIWSPALMRTIDWCATSATSMVLVADGGGAPVALFHAEHVGLSRRRRYVTPGHRPTVGLTNCRLTGSTLGPGLVFATDADVTTRAEAVRVFERAIRRRSGPGGIAIAYREVPGDEMAALPTGRRVRLAVRPTMVLTNEWSDMDGYLQSLPGKWRAQFTKLRSAVRADTSVVTRLADTIDPYEASWLADVVRERHHGRGTPSPPLPACYVDLLGRRDDVRFLTYRRPDGRLLAYTAVYDNGRDLTLLMWGSRGETDGAHRDLYFDQYGHMVELMIASGRRSMVIGKGMEDIKARYGARPVPLWGVMGLA